MGRPIVSSWARICVVAMAAMLFLPLDSTHSQNTYFEGFDSNVFDSANWSRSSVSVAVDIDSGRLVIGNNGNNNDSAVVELELTFPFVLEARIRVTQSSNTTGTLPKIGIVDSSGAELGRISYDKTQGPSGGWLFFGWTNIHTMGPDTTGEWRTIRAIIRADAGELYVKTDQDAEFTFVTSKTWAPNVQQVSKLSFSQHTDDNCEFDYISATPITPATLPYVENFDTDVFVEGTWSRTHSTVAVDLPNGLLQIDNGNAYGDGANRRVDFQLPIIVETKLRLVNEGQNYTLPHLNLIFGPNTGDYLALGFLPGTTYGWAFGPWPSNWTDIQAPTPALGSWWTIRAVIDSTGGKLYVRPDSDSNFTLVTTGTWSIPGLITQIWAVQPWDALCQYDYISAKSYASSDTLRIGKSQNCQTTLDASYSIPIYLDNADTVKAFDIPLDYGWGVDPDSISFTGTRLAGKNGTFTKLISTGGDSIRLGYISLTGNPSDNLEPMVALTQNIPIARIFMPMCMRQYFSPPDTATIPLPVNPVSVELTDKSGFGYVPVILFDSSWVRSYVLGDANSVSLCTISDPVYLINYIFAGGPAPICLLAADADCNGIITISDPVYVINYIFAGGPAPGANCLCGDAPMIAKSTIGSASVATTSSTLDSRSILEVNLDASASVRAVQLDFTASGEVHDIRVTSGADRLQLFSGTIGSEYRVGLIDLTGTAAIPAGSSKVAVVSYEGTGELSIASATVVDNDATEMTVTIGNTKLESRLPIHYELAQNQPNPFNPSTDISFSLPRSGRVKLLVYNILGEEIAVLVDEVKAAGIHRVTWDGKDKSGRAVASGVYFYKLIASDFSQSRKMLLLK